MHMLNIQKCMFVLQLHCTLHSAAWESTVSRANSHTGTQLSSSQRPHNPQAQHSVIPTHQMLCSDWQCWETQGISLLSLILHHALAAVSQTHALLTVEGGGCAGCRSVSWHTGMAGAAANWGRREG